MDRLIAHLDMDAFYASVEVLDNPELAGKPVIVGGTTNRGVVTSATYQARALGVRSAMPIIRARRLCPQGIFIATRMKRYQEKSRQVMAALKDYAPVVEQVSVDEAFLDMTGTEGLYGPPKEIGRQLKDLVLEATGLVCSVGLAPNKLVAKIASDFDKPDGLVVVTPEKVAGFLAPLPVRRLPGVGPKLMERLKLLSIHTVADVRAVGEDDLTALLGDGGRRLLDLAWGRSESRVRTEPEQPKSISAEHTLETDARTMDELIPLMAAQALRVGRRLRAHDLKARTVNIKIKHSDFKQVTRAQTLDSATDSTRIILAEATALLKAYRMTKPVRLIGVGVSNLAPPREIQPSLFQEPRAPAADSGVDKALDRIMGRFGSKAIGMAVSLKKDD